MNLLISRLPRTETEWNMFYKNTLDTFCQSELLKNATKSAIQSKGSLPVKPEHEKDVRHGLFESLKIMEKDFEKYLGWKTPNRVGAGLQLVNIVKEFESNRKNTSRKRSRNTKRKGGEDE